MQPRFVVHPLFVLTLSASLVPGAADASRKTGNTLPAVRVAPVATATIDFGRLAASPEAATGGPSLPFVIASPYGVAEPSGGEADRSAGRSDAAVAAPPELTAVSPAPDLSFSGGDDLPKIGTSTWVIPPGVDGAVGPTRVFSTLNNNFRLTDRAGAVLSTMSIDTFWAATGGSGFYDTRCLYDPANDRFVVAAVSNGGSPSSSVLVGVTLSNDPAGSWYLARFDADVPNTKWADFPLVGLNQSWVAIGVTMVPTGGGISTGRMFVLDYPVLRGGTASASIFDDTPVCAAPAMTYGTEPTLYIPSHRVSATGTYRLDTITGTPALPVYTAGPDRSRGFVWTQPTGVVLPQAGPASGASACGATPCRIEAPDAQIRSTPVFRGGSLWYAQTIGLPAGGFTHTGLLWTKLDAAAGTVADGGVLEDPTASPTSGTWYAFPSVATNASGDMVLGFTRFDAAGWPSAAWAVRSRSDAPGTLNTPSVTKAGEDYYHRELSSGRNRWGDYSKAQVDPADDNALWVLAQHSAARASTDDGSGTSNGSRWGTSWSRISPVVPGEVADGSGGFATSLRFTAKDAIAWNAHPSATGYRVHRGVMSDLPKLLTAVGDSCLRGTTTGTTLTGLAETPGYGFYWYLVTGTTFWGEGTSGNAATGPRQLDSNGSCP